MIDSNYCDFCAKEFSNRNNLFKHYKTISHIKSSEVKVDAKLTCTVWGKYVTEQLPTPYEREFLYKYFQRNWNEKIGDEANYSRIQSGGLPDYITDTELYHWFNTKKMLILQKEEGIIERIDRIEDKIVPYCQMMIDEMV
jgi:hypothetical protein